jgi:hypothetical protein
MATAAAEVVRPEVVMTEAEAKKLTGDIRRRLGDVQQRSERLADAVRRAHHDGAWVAMGYASWGEYVAGEFPDLSRGQNYRLVAWGEVTAELESAAGGTVDVSGRQAAKVKQTRTADEVADEIRTRLADKAAPTDADRREAVEAALAKPTAARARARSAPAEEPSPPEPPAAPEPAIETDAAALADGADRAGRTWWAADPANIVDALLACKPVDAAGVELDRLDALAAWIGQVRAAKRNAKATNTAPAAAKPRATEALKSRAAEVPAGKCPHPVTRRLAGRCMVCSEPVK